MRSVKSYAVLLALLLIIGLCPVPGQAAPSTSGDVSSLLAMNLEQLIEVDVAIATGTSKSLRTAPAVATVVTAEDIEAMGATTLDEALETVPGLHVAPSNKANMRPVYSMRGIHTSLSPQVQFLVNGHPIKQTYTGQLPAGFQMPTSNIARIEVVRGPGSAVYGADAFAGTINVITKDAAGLKGTEAGLRYGSFDTAEAWMQHGGQYGGWDIGVSLTSRTSNGDQERVVDADLQSALDAGFGTKASLAPGPLETSYHLADLQTSFSKDNWTIRLWGLVNHDVGFADGVTQTLSDNSWGDLRQYFGDVTYGNNTLLRDTDLSLSLSHLYINQDALVQVFPAGTVLPIGADGNISDVKTSAGFTLFPDGVYGKPVQIDNQTALDFVSVYKGWDRHRVRLATGLQHVDEDTEESKNFGPGVLVFPAGSPPPPVVGGSMTDVTDTPYVYMPEQSRDLWYASLQDEWALAKAWELTAGVRFDHYSDFGATTNPRLALVWETLTDLTSKLLYGRAFRPPSFNELYVQNNPSNKGNPDLVPETNETLELAFDYRPLARLHLGLNLFTYRIKDLIELVPDPGQTTMTAQNHKDQKGRGFEIEGDWLITDALRLRANFAYQRAKDEDTGEVVPDAPGMKVYANLNWRFQPDWSLDGQYFWIGDRHRAKGDTRPDIKDNNIVNLTLRRKNIAKHWAAALAVRNLFDEDIREPSQPSIPYDYPMESRAVWGELRYSF